MVRNTSSIASRSPHWAWITQRTSSSVRIRYNSKRETDRQKFGSAEIQSDRLSRWVGNRVRGQLSPREARLDRRGNLIRLVAINAAVFTWLPFQYQTSFGPY